MPTTAWPTVSAGAACRLPHRTGRTGRAGATPNPTGWAGFEHAVVDATDLVTYAEERPHVMVTATQPPGLRAAPPEGQRHMSWWHRRRPSPDAAGATSHDTTPEPPILWMTCVLDGREHAVTDDHASAGFALGNGTYDAVCGRTITPHAMTQPPGPRCADCSTLSHPSCSPTARKTGWRWVWRGRSNGLLPRPVDADQPADGGARTRELPCRPSEDVVVTTDGRSVAAGTIGHGADRWCPAVGPRLVTTPRT